MKAKIFLFIQKFEVESLQFDEKKSFLQGRFKTYFVVASSKCVGFHLFD